MPEACFQHDLARRRWLREAGAGRNYRPRSHWSEARQVTPGENPGTGEWLKPEYAENPARGGAGTAFNKYLLRNLHRPAPSSCRRHVSTVSCRRHAIKMIPSGRLTPRGTRCRAPAEEDPDICLRLPRLLDPPEWERSAGVRVLQDRSQA
jgi:hypothetical protein